MAKIDDILSMSDYQRRKLRLKKGRRKKYHCEKRPDFTREELLAYLRKNDFHSPQQLEKGRKQGEPKVYEYLREFGSWREAKMSAFGIPSPPVDPAYIYKSVIEFNLWTEKAYLAARKKRPDIIPPIHVVRKRWGYFRTLKEFARRFCIKMVVEDYWKLKRKLGRHPDLAECRAEGIHLDKVVEFFDGKKALEKFVDSLEAQNEEKRGSS